MLLNRASSGTDSIGHHARSVNMTNPTPIRSRMIDTTDLRRTFMPRGGTVEAVAGVDLHVGSGEIFGLLGPNGAGKTTTLRMLATLITPPAGEAARARA